jgi:hypothetical protein
MAVFSGAHGGVYAVFEKARQCWHRWMLGDEKLGCPELKLTIQMANPIRDNKGESKGPALTDDGWPVAGKVKVTSHHDRVAGLNDVVVDIDEEAWDDMSEQTQLALADSLLCRLELKVKNGTAVLDDCGRPKLVKRKPDARVGDIYYEVAHRHGKHASEVKNLTKIWDETKEYVQTNFNYGTWG